MTVAAPEVLFTSDELEAANAAEKIYAVPTQTRQFIDRQRSELQAALQAVTLQPLTKEQWDDLLRRSKAADQSGNQSVAAVAKISDPRKKRSLAQLNQLASTQAELDLIKDHYLRALDKYPSELEFCLANQRQ